MKKNNKLTLVFALILAVGTVFPSLLIGGKEAFAAEAPTINAAAKICN